MLVALVVLFASAIRLRVLQIPLERDEGEYAYAGQLILQGIPPYQLALNMKFPGTYGAYAAIMAIFGRTISGIHLGLLVVNAGTIVLIYLLGRRLFTAPAGVAASAAYAILSVGAGVMGTQAHATHFVVAAAVAGVLLLLRALDSNRSSTVFWSGLILGVAVLMKQHGALFAVFGGLFLIWSLRIQRQYAWRSVAERLALYVGGVIAPLALTGLVLWRAGVFAKFWFWSMTYAREYALENSVSDGITNFKSVFPSVVEPNLGIWMVAAAGLLLLWREKKDRANAIFATGFLAVSFLALCPGLYFREHYFVLMLPAVALLAGSAVVSARRITGALLTYGLYGAALLFSVVVQQEAFFQMTPLEASRAMYGLSPFPEAVVVANYIRDHSAKESRIAVLGSEPEIYFYADRHSATGYIYAYGLMEAQPFALTMQNEMIHDLEASRPEYMVVVTVPSTWKRMPDSPSRIFEWLGDYCLRHYKMVGVVDMVSTDHTVYRWENVEAYRPQSPNLISVFKRTDP